MNLLFGWLLKMQPHLQDSALNDQNLAPPGDLGYLYQLHRQFKTIAINQLRSEDQNEYIT